ncbi:MAG: ATP-dependent DNA helicase, partial [Roseburia sp.]|nr:ATP-dependent DNA helicase [Roseburia sp.]
LVERSREMYSAEIYKEDFLAVKKLIKKYDAKLASDFDKCNKVLLDYKRECEKYVVYDNIGTLVFGLMRLAGNLDEFLRSRAEFPERKEVTEFYLNLRNFMNTYELVDENYEIYSEHEEDGRFKLKLYCVDPSRNLQERLDKGNSTIFFSATLLPIQYYKNLLSTKKDNYAVYAETAFSEEQRLLLLGKDVSSRYTRRNRNEFQKIAAYILRTALAHKGNYMVFFPSYKMMQQVYEVFCEENEIAEEIGQVNCIVQQTGMREAEREAFLAAFSEENSRAREKSLVAFCVLGGIFGEGIDLKNEQLVGAIIVGTGLPQISNEREILMNYYNKRSGEGFDYAYRYPGMNKVLQAAGRVIRTVTDVGVIELLDERFLQSDYGSLFPREWENFTVCNVDTVDEHLREFWDEKEL